MSRLIEYDYPGNVRELENIIERSLALCSESELNVCHLPNNLSQGGVQKFGADTEKSRGQPLSLEEYERNYILSVLKSVNGNKTKAAKIMGIDRVSLWRKLKRYKTKGYNIDHYLKN
jgi:transcriptional regulator with PAS, ATPase and Fis domain